MESTKICVSCGGPLIKRLKRGLINQCDRCGTKEERQREVRRTVGLVGGGECNKSNVIGIFKNPTAQVAAWVKRHNGGGYGPHTDVPLGGFGSTGAEKRELAEADEK